MRTYAERGHECVTQRVGRSLTGRPGFPTRQLGLLNSTICVGGTCFFSRGVITYGSYFNLQVASCRLNLALLTSGVCFGAAFVHELKRLFGRRFM